MEAESHGRSGGVRSRIPQPAWAPLVGFLVLVVGGLGDGRPASAQELHPGDPAFWGVSGAALVVAWLYDEELRRNDPSRRGPTAHRLARAGYHMGGRDTLIPVLAGAVVLTHLTDWPTDSRRMLHVLGGAAAAGLVTEGVKSAVGRGRPRDVGDPRRFRPFNRTNAWMAFPSGHATAGFGIAAALAEEFDLGGYEAVAYGLAGLIAWSRVYDDAHWASDTVAGAIIGITVAHATVAWLNRGRDRESTTPDPSASPGIPILLFTLPLP